MEKTIENKVVLVTGGASGLGLSMVENFLRKSAKVLIIVDYNEEQGIEATKSLNSKYGKDKAVFYKCDVALDMEETIKKIIDIYTYVDVIVNNAGVLDEKSIKRTIDINTTALMEWTVKFYEYMRKDKRGRGGTIINVSSIYGFRIIPYIPYYQASKHAVIGFSKSLGHEYNYEKSGVRVVVLCPGLTYTNMCANPNARDDESMPDFITDLKKADWQNTDAIGEGIIEVFEKAESGTVWLVEGARPAERV